MSSQATLLLRLLGPRIPLILSTIFTQLLRLSPESAKWDLRVALGVNILRSIVSGSKATITKQQNLSMKGEIKGNMWVAPVTLPADAASTDGLSEIFFEAIDSLSAPHQKGRYERSGLEPVEAEWTSHRRDVAKHAPEPPNLTPAEKFSAMAKETTSRATVLYIHGGALYLCDPASHRPVVSRLMKECGGRALSLRYRLAPQHAFPAALLDCLVAYLSLLHPPAGSLHDPVAASDIVLAGDSAGGNLALALCRLLLQLNHLCGSRPRRITFNSEPVTLPLPLPAGLALASPWTDLTRSLPSLHSNAHYDYLPPPSAQSYTPGQAPNPRPCAAWPRLPPRADLYCQGEMLDHPLVSPLAVPAAGWAGAPATYFLAGEEELSDEIGVVARRVARAGAPVRHEAFEAMPHVFAMVMPSARGAPRAMSGWGSFVRAGVAAARGEAQDKALSGAVWVTSPGLEERDVDVGSLCGEVSDEEVWRRMSEERSRRVGVFEGVVKGGTGQGGVEGEGPTVEAAEKAKL